MPIYEYECTKCGKIEEALQKFSDKPLTKCRHCAGRLTKLVSHSSFHLKGSGWYVTDYAGKKQDTSKPSQTATESKANDTKGSDSGSASPKTPSEKSD
jgi:putative FmdB family regulatory protein